MNFESGILWLALIMVGLVAGVIMIVLSYQKDKLENHTPLLWGGVGLAFFSVVLLLGTMNRFGEIEITTMFDGPKAKVVEAPVETLPDPEPPIFNSPPKMSETQKAVYDQKKHLTDFISDKKTTD